MPKKLEINYNHLKRYLVYGYKFLHKTSDTYFHGIQEIEYASNATVDYDLNFAQSKYWVTKSKVKAMSMDEAVEGAFAENTMAERHCAAVVSWAFTCLLMCLGTVPPRLNPYGFR